MKRNDCPESFRASVAAAIARAGVGGAFTTSASWRAFIAASQTCPVLARRRRLVGDLDALAGRLLRSVLTARGESTRPRVDLHGETGTGDPPLLLTVGDGIGRDPQPNLAKETNRRGEPDLGVCRLHFLKSGVGLLFVVKIEA